VDALEEVLHSLSSEVALLCDKDGRVRWADPRANAFFGSLLDLDFVDLAAPEVDDKARRFFQEACSQRTEVWELVLVARGRPVLMAFRGSPRPDGALLVGSLVPQHYAALQDQVSQIMGDFTTLQRETERQRRQLARAHADIEQLLTAERAARTQVEAERARLQQVLDSLPEAIIIVDAEGEFVVANVAAADLLGLNLIGERMPTGSEPALDAHRFDGSPLEARELPLQRSALDGEVVYGEQLVVRHAQRGVDVPLLVNSAPLVGPDGHPAGAVAVFQDITAIKELERQKDEFLAAVSHDLRNPLAGIKGWAQILRRRSRRLPESERDRWHKDLTTLENGATRMASILEDLLDLAQLQMGGRLELRKQPTDLVQLVRRIVTSHQQVTQRHTILVRTEVAVLEGEWDPTRLERVVENLLSNAVKYSPDGGKISVSLSCEQTDGSSAAVLTVEDQGVGVPPEELPRIFERYYRASNVAGRIAGTGIGLAGAKQLVEQHGGTIQVESAPGVGTTFTVRLPVSDTSVDGPGE
jgi:PAS domain S-box-containing protein